MLQCYSFSYILSYIYNFLILSSYTFVVPDLLKTDYYYYYYYHYYYY